MPPTLKTPLALASAGVIAMKMFLSMVTCLSQLLHRAELVEHVPATEVHGMADARLHDGYLVLAAFPCSSTHRCVGASHSDNAVVVLAQLICDPRENT